MSTKYRELLELIERSESFDEVRSSGLLPEPDSDEGYYFVSYSHKDYRAVLRDIVDLREAGASLWYDRGLELGKSWIKEVKQKLSSYYCKGVIVYLSESYLSSLSCMIELDHLISLINRGVLFVTLDGVGNIDGDRIAAALEEHSLPTFESPVVTTGAFFSRAFWLSASAGAEEKLALCRRFPKLDLLEYTYLWGAGGVTSKVMDIFFGKCAAVSGVVDKNVSRVVVPSFVMHDGRKYRVVQISTAAFMQCDLLEEVVVSDGWINIGHHAFVRCPSLRRVILGKPRRVLGFEVGTISRAFDRCPQAEIVYNGATKYYSAFKGDDSIEEVKHKRGVTYFGECFSGCSRLRSVELGRADNFSARMFLGCTSLTEVKIPKNNVTASTDRSFEGCVNLSEISLPARLRIIGSRSFYGCSSLTEITIPGKVKSIEPDAFVGCTSIRSVTLECKKLTNYKRVPFYRGALLDELFPSAESFYLRHVPGDTAIFVGNFEEIESDKRGYRLFRRGRA